MSDPAPPEEKAPAAAPIRSPEEVRKALLDARRLYRRLHGTKGPADRHALETASGWLFTLLAEVSPEYVRGLLDSENPDEGARVLTSAARLTDSLSRLEDRLLAGIPAAVPSRRTSLNDPEQLEFLQQLGLPPEAQHEL
jgi:hypothetical protein